MDTLRSRSQHCTAWAWDSQFLSHTEQLWRVASISVTAVPLFIAVVVWLNSQGFKYFHFVIISVSSLCIPARLTLLVLPLISLRSHPPGAFKSVNRIQLYLTSTSLPLQNSICAYLAHPLPTLLIPSPKGSSQEIFSFALAPPYKLLSISNPTHRSRDSRAAIYGGGTQDVGGGIQARIGRYPPERFIARL
jgi:hypothetical protein